MTMSFTCECGKTFQVQEEHAGKRAKCSACGKVNVLPRKEGLPSESQKPQRHSQGETAVAKSPTETTGTSGMAVFSLVLGLILACLVGAMLVTFYLEIYMNVVSDTNQLIFIITAVLSFLTSCSAIGLGFAAIRQISQARDRLKGKGLAISGILAGIVGIIIDLLILLALILPAFLKVRDAGKAPRANLVRPLDVLTCAFHNNCAELHS